LSVAYCVASGSVTRAKGWDVFGEVVFKLTEDGREFDFKKCLHQGHPALSIHQRMAYNRGKVAAVDDDIACKQTSRALIECDILRSLRIGYKGQRLGCFRRSCIQTDGRRSRVRL